MRVAVGWKETFYQISAHHDQSLACPNHGGRRGNYSSEIQFLADQYKLIMQAILLTVEGLGVITVQQAINAAIDVLNKAIKA